MAPTSTACSWTEHRGSPCDSIMSGKEKAAAKKKKKASVGLQLAAGPPYGTKKGSKKTVAKTKTQNSEAKAESKDVPSSGKDKKSSYISNMMSKFDYDIDDDNSSSDGDYSDDEDEGAESYKPGGYHPVMIGDKFNQARYTVVSKLGWGHFSTVWMCHDKRAVQLNTPEFIALKIQKSAFHYTEAALDEIELLNTVAKAVKSDSFIEEFGYNYDPCIIALTDNFFHTGPYGKHACMGFEVLGENLLKVIKRYNYRGIPISIVKSIVRQICVGLDVLHRVCSIIHTDLKPENILVARPPSPPSMEIVMGLVAGELKEVNNSNCDGSKKKKKKKGGGGATLQSTMQSVESIEKQLSSTKISAEQRRKLKKKLKKKRQQERKKEGGRKGGARRKGSLRSLEKKPSSRLSMDMEKKSRGGASKGKGGGKLDLTAMSEDKIDILNEMIMMERESLPVAYNEKRRIDLAESEGNDGDGDYYIGREERGEDLAGNIGIYGDDSPGVSRDVFIARNSLLGDDDINSIDADDDDIYASNGIGGHTIGGRLVDSNECATWLRPSFFAHLNFTSQAKSGEVLAADEITFRAAVPLRSGAYFPPPTELLARICMVTCASKLYEAFGAPEQYVDSKSDDDDIFVDWRLALCAESSSSQGSEDPSLHFIVRGHGEDGHEAMSLAACCILNDLVSSNTRLTIVPTEVKAERPIVWTIIHNATITEHLLSFLEDEISGVKFLVAFDVPEVLLEDDIEILYVTKRACQHPVSNDLLAEYPITSDVTGGRSLTIHRGSGALMGMDLDCIMRSMAIVSDGKVVPVTPEMMDFNLCEHVLPLEARMHYFIGEANDSIIKIANDLFQLRFSYDREGYNYNGYDSCDSAGNDDDVDHYADMNYINSETNIRSTADLDEEYKDASIKIVDLGNACWTHKHFTDDIQTRQYRSPEVLLGTGYDTSADMWSLGCIVFELLTGDLLFDPHAGKTWDREEDHLAMMIELLGDFPKAVYSAGKKSSEYFTKGGALRHIKQLKYWSLKEVFSQKYKLGERDSEETGDFLEAVLNSDPALRCTAAEALRHPWLAPESRLVTTAIDADYKDSYYVEDVDDDGV